MYRPRAGDSTDLHSEGPCPVARHEPAAARGGHQRARLRLGGTAACTAADDDCLTTKAFDQNHATVGPWQPALLLTRTVTRRRGAAGQLRGMPLGDASSAVLRLGDTTASPLKGFQGSGGRGVAANWEVVTGGVATSVQAATRRHRSLHRCSRVERRVPRQRGAARQLPLGDTAASPLKWYQGGGDRGLAIDVVTRGWWPPTCRRRGGAATGMRTFARWPPVATLVPVASVVIDQRWRLILSCVCSSLVSGRLWCSTGE